MRNLFLIVVLLTALNSYGQSNWSERMSASAMRLWPDSFLLPSDKSAKWRYDQGVILKGIDQVWMTTGEGKWFNYIQSSMDHFVRDDGTIKGYKQDEFNLDHLNNGKLLLMLYQVTGREKYRKAVELLRNQLLLQPRTKEGGFWHKKIYPGQMWLDGLYMCQPFYAEYAKIFHQDSVFNDVARQFILMEKYARDSLTGLLKHGYDDLKQQKWAHPESGLSSNFWGRSLGWFGMALVDVLDHFPKEHPKRDTLVDILKRLSRALSTYQHAEKKIWYNLPDKINLQQNYFEASASCMIAYTFAKGARMGYLPREYLYKAQQAFSGVIQEFITTDSSGLVHLKGTVAVSGLGGNPYRDGSIAYYLSEPVVEDDPKGIGAFILCSAEIEKSKLPQKGKGKVVLLDYYFNNEWKTNASQNTERWHYTWEDKSNSGFSLLGDLFLRNGALIKSLEKAPDSKALSAASIYIIVDPDTEKESINPHYIDQQSIEVISSWVKAGGVLVLLGNDSANVEFSHFNQLAACFGIYFNENSLNRVKGNNFSEGLIVVPRKHPFFKDGTSLFIKEFSTLQLTTPAISILEHKESVVMAISKYGKGTVFALGDPWIYNEYLDGRKLPAEFKNFKAANEWVQWLLSVTK